MFGTDNRRFRASHQNTSVTREMLCLRRASLPHFVVGTHNITGLLAVAVNGIRTPVLLNVGVVDDNDNVTADLPFVAAGANLRLSRLLQVITKRCAIIIADRIFH